MRRVSLFLWAKSWSMIMPSAPLSRRAVALIVDLDRCPTRKTLSETEGDRILRMVPLGTGSESTVCRREAFRSDISTDRILQDSARVGDTRNPGFRSPGQDGKGQSGVPEQCKGGRRWVLGLVLWFQWGRRQLVLCGCVVGCSASEGR